MGNIPTHLRRFSHNGVCAPLRVGCALPHAPPMHRGLWICTSFTSSPVRCGWAFPNPIRYTAPESRTPNGPSAEKQNAGENHRHAAPPATVPHSFSKGGTRNDYINLDAPLLYHIPAYNVKTIIYIILSHYYCNH